VSAALGDAVVDSGREGSAACVAVLLVLNRWRVPLRFGELQAETGLAEADLHGALRGLQYRSRVQRIGRGGGTEYALAYCGHLDYTSRAAMELLAARGMT
jgi:hypothetical protein